MPSGSGSFVEGEDLQAQRPAIRVKIAEQIQDKMIQLQSALLRTCSWAVKELSNLVADLVYLGVGQAQRKTITLEVFGAPQESPQISAVYLGDDLQAFLPMTTSNGMESFQSLQSKCLGIHLHRQKSQF